MVSYLKPKIFIGLAALWILAVAPSARGEAAATANPDVRVAEDEEYVYVTGGNARVLSCPGAPRKDDADCRTSREDTRPEICRVNAYEREYNAGWSRWNREHPDREMPDDFEVFSMIVPTATRHRNPGSIADPRSEATQVALVNVYRDPDTRRILHYTVERREPPERPNPGGVRSYWDPRMPVGALPDDAFDGLRGDTVEEMGESFDRQLSLWIARAGGSRCDFAEDHEREVAYARDPLLRDVDSFFGDCSNSAFPCCGGRDPAVRVDCPAGGAVVSETAAGNLQDIASVIDRSNEDFNLDLIHQLRMGLLSSQLSIQAVTPSEAGLDTYGTGPRNGDGALRENAACTSQGGSQNADLGAVVRGYAGYFGTGNLPGGGGEGSLEALDARRRELEWENTRRTVADTLEYMLYSCHFLWLQYGLGLAHPEPESRMYQVLNRNRVIGMAGRERTKELYRTIKANLSGTPLGEGIDWDMFENRERCRHPDSIAQLGRLSGRITGPEAGTPEHDRVRRTLMDPAGILGKTRELKRAALSGLRSKLNRYTGECDDADEMYHNGVFTRDGLELWSDRYLVESLVRDYAREGRGTELARFKYIYCQNRDEFDRGERVKSYVMIGATAAAVALPVLGPLVAGGSAGVGVLATGLAVGAAGLDVAITARDAYSAYGAAELAQATYSAQMSNAQHMDETRREFYSAVAATGVAAGLGAWDVFEFARAYGRFARASAGRRALQTAEREAYERVSRAVRAGDVPEDALARLVETCTRRGEDCTGAVMEMGADLAARDGIRSRMRTRLTELMGGDDAVRARFPCLN